MFTTTLYQLRQIKNDTTQHIRKPRKLLNKLEEEP